MCEDDLIAGLSPGLRRAILRGFAGPFSERSDAGMWREWPDIVFQTGVHRSFRNTIAPLIARGLAERRADGLCRLTAKGLEVRLILQGCQ